MATPKVTARGITYFVIVLIAGALAGVLWHTVVSIPTFLTSADGSVQMTERSQAQIFMIDAVFALIGLLLGILIGILSWQMSPGTSWRTVVVTFIATLLAGLVCWGVGTLMGPSDFASRVVPSQPGDKVPIDFTLRAHSVLAAWCVGGMIAMVGYTLNIGGLIQPLLARRRARTANIGETGLEQVSQDLGSDLDGQATTPA